MKVLVLANNSGGLYRFRKELLERLIALGHQVYISLPYGDRIDLLVKKNCKFIDTPIDRRGINPITDLVLMCKYFKILKQIKPDKVITYTIKPNIYGGIVCRMKRVPTYANITGLGTMFQNSGLLNKLVTTMYKTALKKARTVFFENTENCKILTDKRIVEKDKTCCLHGAGVNTEEYRFADYPPDGTIRFLFMGRIMREKGVNELFEAASRLKSKHDVEIDVLGGLEEDYKNIIDELARNHIVNYYGYQSDVKPFIEQAHCFVLPSYHEGMANTLLESAAMGRPLITSNIHGCMEAVLDNETGFLCEVQNTEDLYEKMKKFIELPYDKKREMGRLSHEYVIKNFDKKEVVSQTIKNIFNEE